MRFGPVVLMMLVLSPKAIFSQQTPDVDQMRQVLDASQRRGQLEMEGETPFHLVASYEEFDAKGNSAGKGTLDELWAGPRRYRQILTLPNMKQVKFSGEGQFQQDLKKPTRKLIEVDSGTQLWRTGLWVLDEPVILGFEAALKPFHLLSPTTKQLSYEGPWKRNPALECIATEPDLPGVSEDTRLALTEYCMEQGNHIVHLISRPNAKEITLNDIKPFGNKYIARSIEVGINGKVRLKLHIDVLETATDFHELDVEPPAEVQLLPFHRVDLHYPYLTGELMRGQLLNGMDLHSLVGVLHGTVTLTAHVDTTGAVTSVDVARSSNPILTASVVALIRKWRFRVSYMGTKLVPVSYSFDFVF